MGLCLNTFSIGQGVRKKYLTAKRGPQPIKFWNRWCS